MDGSERRATPDSALRALERIVGETYLRTDDDALDQVSKDETADLRPVRPDAWVRPGSVEEVQAVLRECDERGVFVTPRGAGTGHAGGAVATQGGIVLGLDRLANVLEVRPDDLVARVEPGVITGDFQAAVEDEGLFYAPDPASLAMCTIGGNAATNAGGPRAVRYGVTGDWVLGIDAVLPSGERIQTGRQSPKGVTGLDLKSLLVGSEGTLAVIVGLTLKLMARPRAVSTGLAVFASAEDAARAVSATLGRGLVPRCCEYLDKDAIAALLSVEAPYTFPAGAGAALVLEADGADEDEAFARLAQALEVCGEVGLVDSRLATDEAQRRRIWETRRMLSKAVRAQAKQKVAEDVAVPRSQVPALVTRFAALGERHGLRTCAYGHAGDGNLHAQILFDDEDQRPQVNALLEDLFRLTVELGGTLSGEHGIGAAKRRYLPLEQSPGLIDLQRQVKRAFDPRGILNPGKVWPDP